MSEASNINDILSQVKRLGREDQLSLLERLVLIIKKQGNSPSVRLSSIGNLGAEVWQGTDIDKYIETEREW